MSKSNRILALEDDVTNISELPEIDELDLSEFQNEALEEMRLNQRALESLEITLDLCGRLKNKPNLSMEDIGFFHHSLDLSLAGLPFNNTVFSQALESNQSPLDIVLAVEGTAINKLQSFSTTFKNTVEKMGSVLKYQFSFFNALEKKLQETIKEVERSSDNAKRSITVKVDRWMCYGDNKQITSFAEYLTELDKATKSIDYTLEAVTTFNDKVRFLGPKVLFSYLPVIGDIWGVFRKAAATIFSLVLGMSKMPGMTKFKQTQSASYYETKTLLGLFKIISIVPKGMDDLENTEDPTEDATRSQVAVFLKSIDIGIETQRYSHENTGSVTFDNVSKTDVIKMLKSMETMVINYQEFNKLSNRLLNFYHGANYAATMATPLGIIGNIVSRYISYRQRVLYKALDILAEVMSQTYKVSNNTIKKGIEIARKY